jgi:hypothetical protein
MPVLHLGHDTSDIGFESKSMLMLTFWPGRKHKAHSRFLSSSFPVTLSSIAYSRLMTFFRPGSFSNRLSSIVSSIYESDR